jgi:hypothetical protein
MRGNACNSLLQEHAADHSVVTSRLCNLQFHMAGDAPDSIDALGKVGNALRIEDRTSCRVENTNGLCARCLIPVQTVDCDLMNSLVRKVDIDKEVGCRGPAARNTPSGGQVLKSPNRGRSGSPGIGVLARRNWSYGGVYCPVADYGHVRIVVCVLPVALSRGVQALE